jgi:hypothetical protein
VTRDNTQQEKIAGKFLLERSGIHFVSVIPALSTTNMLIARRRLCI